MKKLSRVYLVILALLFVIFAPVESITFGFLAICGVVLGALTVLALFEAFSEK